MGSEKVIKVPAPLMGNKLVSPVTSKGIKKKKKEEARFPVLLPVQGVLVWAFALACSVVVAILFSHIPIPCSQSQTAWIFQCPDLTPAQGDEVKSFGEGSLWLTVPQAAASMVGLLLPRRHSRSRWSLALLAIVSATLAHYMNARMNLVFVAANPGDIGYMTLAGFGAVVCVAGDLLGLFSLVIRGPE